MRRTFVLLAMAGAILVALGGCAIFGSPDADILTFDISGLVGTATIDTAARTITATVEPMSLAGVAPTVTVSSKAELTAQPALVDGQAVTYVVKAENTKEVTWTVTVTVEYGISFTYDSTHVVLTKGIIHSTNSTTNTQLGNGVPLTTLGSSGAASQVYAFLEPYDYAHPSNSGLTIAMLQLAWAGAPAAGTYDQTKAAFQYQVGSPALSLAAGPQLSTSVLSVELSAYGAVGADAVGTFSGTVVNSADATLHPLTGGFLKVIRIANGLLG
jgi:hypothetical protein